MYKIIHTHLIMIKHVCTVEGLNINSLCPLTTPPSSLVRGSEFTMSRSPASPIQPFVQNNLEINSDMKSALDRSPVHKTFNSTVLFAYPSNTAFQSINYLIRPINY
jgi:hypothetical protein